MQDSAAIGLAISIAGLAVSLVGTIVVATWKGAQLASKLENRSSEIDSIPLLTQRVGMVEKVVESLAASNAEVRPSVAGLKAEMGHVRDRLESHSGEMRAVRVPTPPQPFRPVRRPSRPDIE